MNQQFVAMRIQKSIPYLIVFWSLLFTIHWTQARVSNNVLKVHYSHDTLQAKAWVKLSNKTLATNKALSLSYADSAYHLFKELKNKNGMGDALVRMGLARNGLGEYDAALANYDEALGLFRELKNQNKVAKVLNNIGYSQMQKGFYTEAISNYLLSLEIRRTEKDSSGIAACYTNIAIVFAIKSDLEQAEKYFKDAVNIYRSLKDDVMLHKNLLNLAGIYKDRGQYRKSIDHIHKVQLYYVKQNIRSEIARCMYNLGSNYEGLKLYDSAYFQYQQALKIYQDLQDKKQITGTKLRLAALANLRKDYGAAVEEGIAALAMAKSMKALQLELQTYLSLAQSYANMGNYEKAYLSRMEYDRIKDSIFSQESDNKVRELEAQYQNKNKKREIESLQAGKKIADLEIKKKRNFNYFLSGILFLLVVVCALIYSLYRFNKRNNQELTVKNKIIEVSLKEKEILLREIHHRVKNNLQFIWSLFNLQARHVKDPEALRTLNEGKNRVKTMALIHQKLYQSENLIGIDMADYIPGLTSNIFETYHVSQDQVQLQLDIDNMVLEIDTAIPLGLIMNELLTNILKHGLKSEGSTSVFLSLKKMDANVISLIVQDDGPGIPETVNPDASETFGLKLVKSLCKQLKANINWPKGEGTKVSIDIPLSNTSIA